MVSLGSVARGCRGVVSAVRDLSTTPPTQVVSRRCVVSDARRLSTTLMIQCCGLDSVGRAFQLHRRYSSFCFVSTAVTRCSFWWL